MTLPKSHITDSGSQQQTVYWNPADATRFVMLAIGIGATFFLVIGVNSISLGARVGIAIPFIVLVYIASGLVANRLQIRKSAAEILDALFELQMASTISSVSVASGVDVRLQGLSPMSNLVDNRLLSEAEAAIIKFWSVQVLKGARVSPDTLQRVAEFAQYLAERVSQVTSPPRAPAQGAQPGT